MAETRNSQQASSHLHPSSQPALAQPLRSTRATHTHVLTEEKGVYRPSHRWVRGPPPSQAWDRAQILLSNL